MKFWLKLLLVVLVLGGGVAAAFQPAMKYWKTLYRTKYRTAEVIEGKLISVVNSTGEVKPVLNVQVGSFVSGPVLELYVNFNDKVKKNQILAKIDPRIYEASVARDQAILATRKADISRVEALLQQAKNNERRAHTLQDENEDYISETEMDQVKFNRMSLEAQLDVAKASVKQADASLANSNANLGYTEIRSPVDGIVIKRFIDPGQTLAAQFQAPQLFTVAPEMDVKMLVFASVDEADIGLIRQAQKQGQPVRFTVDAYPDDLFEGVVSEVRLSSESTQNVVTYPVVVEAPNTEMKLLPGMTASLSFQIKVRENVVKIPNAALRFYPEEKKVRKEDRKILEGGSESQDDDDTGADFLSASEKAEAGRKRNRRHVWVEDGEFLRAIEVRTGISDSRFTELASGELKVGQKLVTGIDNTK